MKAQVILQRVHMPIPTRAHIPIHIRPLCEMLCSTTNWFQQHGTVVVPDSQGPHADA